VIEEVRTAAERNQKHFLHAAQSERTQNVQANGFAGRMRFWRVFSLRVTYKTMYLYYSLYT
jgi:hypothetical protein